MQFGIFMNYWSTGLGVRVFTKGPEDWGPILGRVIPKTPKKKKKKKKKNGTSCLLALHSIIRYGSRVK